MSVVFNVLSTAFDLLLVVLGFSAIIVIHELGHFLAAKWAGIRVLAFSVGFGPALVTYRKGLGFGRASTEQQYLEQQRLRRAGRNVAAGDELSPTEYRLNALPLGGYVKMLGQDDADPTAVSDEPDSYQRCATWKRMVVISAGVFANLVLAAVLFVIVFKIGLLSESAKIGDVVPGRPASVAIAENAKQFGVTTPGLQSDDVVLSIDGEKPNHFQDVVLAIAMSKRGDPVAIQVRRAGIAEPLDFRVRPEIDPETGMLGIGVSPAQSNQISPKLSPADVTMVASSRGITGLAPGMRLVAVNGQPAKSPNDVQRAVDASNGSPVIATFESAGSGGEASTGAARTDITLKPLPRLQRVSVEVDSKSRTDVMHLVGLTPVLAVQTVTLGSPAEKVGLKEGDIFVQIGSAEWPSIAEGISQIRAHTDKNLGLTVLRRDSKTGVASEIKLNDVRVGTNGRIGFAPTDSSRISSDIAGWPAARTSGVGATPTGATLPIKPGSRIVSVDGQPTPTLGDVRERLKASLSAGKTGVEMQVELPVGQQGAVRPTETIAWTLTGEEAAQVKALGWESPLDAQFFDLERFVWKADGIGGAVRMGLHETHRVMMMTYLTFARLVQGTVKIEHLKGPVGIAHVGVKIADRGLVWLLFFLALISVNLAVINFLPIPIADGGHMVFLLYEQFTGKPPAASVQNAAAVIGLVLLGGVFLIVTFHDVGNLVSEVARWVGR